MTAQLPQAVLEQRVVAVARGQDRQTAPALARALHAGGLTVLEITVEGQGGIEAIAASADIPTHVGAGTVTTLDQASDAVDAGASFLVSPHVDRELMAWASSNRIPFIPGVFTPTEIHTALAARAPAVKLFPASVGGPKLSKSLLGPYPNLAAIPTGGVDDGNARAHLEAGASAVGVGGWLTGDTDLSEVTRRADSRLNRSLTLSAHADVSVHSESHP
jgi:2-dehydro-3-deoxyphosphogluconate aldolase/(4S)-4-hydroxy-2-oxoglutarate aldolase